VILYLDSSAYIKNYIQELNRAARQSGLTIPDILP